MTSTSFGLLIAYLLPGILGLYGVSLWSPSVSRVFATFITSQSNVGLFLLVVLAALVVGLLVSGVRWLLLEEGLFAFLFKRDRTLFHLARGDRDLIWIRCPHLTPIRGADYVELAKSPDRLVAYRAFVDEVYRFFQWWSGVAVVFPVVLAGWIHHVRPTPGWIRYAELVFGAILVEVAVLAKAGDSHISTIRVGSSILRGGGGDASSEEINAQEVDG